MDLTLEKLTEIRNRLIRDCDNCEGAPTGHLGRNPFAPYSCPECEDDPGKTSDPDVSVDEVHALIDEIERLRAEIVTRDSQDICSLLVHNGIRCNDCPWCDKNPEELEDLD